MGSSQSTAARGAVLSCFRATRIANNAARSAILVNDPLHRPAAADPPQTSLEERKLEFERAKFDASFRIEAEKLAIEREKFALSRSWLVRFGPLATPIAVVIISGALSLNTLFIQQDAAEAAGRRQTEQFRQAQQTEAVRMFFNIRETVDPGKPELIRSTATFFAEYFPVVYPSVHCFITDRLFSASGNLGQNAIAAILDQLPRPRPGAASACQALAAPQQSIAPATPPPPPAPSASLPIPAPPPPAAFPPPRPSDANRQYRVFLHFLRQDDTEAVQRIRSRLTALGYTVPPPQLINQDVQARFSRASPIAQGRGEVRYYRAGQRQDAEGLADALRSMLAPSIEWQALSISALFPNLPDGVMEIWFPPDIAGRLLP